MKNHNSKGLRYFKITFLLKTKKKKHKQQKIKHG